MMAWALIVNGTVAQLDDVDPAGRYHPSLVWVVAPAGTAVGDAYVSGVFSSAQQAPPATLDTLRASLAAYRYSREIAGVMFKSSAASAAALLATGRDDQSKLGNAFAMATSSHWVDGTPWKMADGSFMPMTTADIEAAAIKAATYVAYCYAHEAVLSAALATNPGTDITQGWPSNT